MDENTINNLRKHDFEYLSELGSGGFGAVVKVKHNISQQTFAVKKLKSSRQENPENILREIRAIAQINDPNIINYNHSFIEDNELYLIMEYCSNGSLRDWLSKKGKLSIDYAANLFLKLTRTFSFLHNKGYIHHDIKPDNILFTEKQVKISDFGTVNTSIGTIAYSAPEMLMPDAPVNDPRVDIFALGITFMECITGENPLRYSITYDEHNLIVKNADFPIGGLPYWLQQLLLKACHFNPSARFQTMLEFHEAIKRRHIPQIISDDRIKSEKLATKLKMLIIGRKWYKAKKLIENNDNKSISYLIQMGKYFLGTNQLEKAKEVFEDVLRKDNGAHIEKNIAEIYLQLNEPSKAATILHGYINNHFRDIEAHNQLLNSYFLSEQWELGLKQANYLIEIFKNELLFINNKLLFELLVNVEEVRLSHEKPNKEENPIGYYNINVINSNEPASIDLKNKRSLKSKLLFHEYKFKNLHSSKNTITVEIDGEEIDCNDHVITFGRKNFDYNTFSMFDDSNVSRRHFVVLNQKNNVWLFDLSTLGTYVNGKKVNRKAFLLGRNEVEFGHQKIYIKSDRSLLL